MNHFSVSQWENIAASQENPTNPTEWLEKRRKRWKDALVDGVPITERESIEISRALVYGSPDAAERFIRSRRKGWIGKQIRDGGSVTEEESTKISGRPLSSSTLSYVNLLRTGREVSQRQKSDRTRQNMWEHVYDTNAAIDFPITKEESKELYNEGYTSGARTKSAFTRVKAMRQQKIKNSDEKNAFQSKLRRLKTFKTKHYFKTQIERRNKDLEKFTTTLIEARRNKMNVPEDISILKAALNSRSIFSPLKKRSIKEQIKTKEALIKASEEAIAKLPATIIKLQMNIKNLERADSHKLSVIDEDINALQANTKTVAELKREYEDIDNYFFDAPELSKYLSPVRY